MNVSLRPLEDRDLDTIYHQVTDPESVRMAAFTAEDQTDRRAFLNRMSRLRGDTSVSYRVIDVDGAIAGTIASFRIDNQPATRARVARARPSSTGTWSRFASARRRRACSFAASSSARCRDSRLEK
jgi:hypothetical protein